MSHAGLSAADFRKHLMRHLGGLEALVLVEMDRLTVQPADLSYHRMMIRRTEEVLSSWRTRVEEVAHSR